MTVLPWNTCVRRSCRGPVEGLDGSVEFFDGTEARCLTCDKRYVVIVVDESAWLEPLRVKVANGAKT